VVVPRHGAIDTRAFEVETLGRGRRSVRMISRKTYVAAPKKTT